MRPELTDRGRVARPCPSTGATLRTARFLRVITDLQTIKHSGLLSPDTSTALEQLLEKARNPSTDIDLLEIAKGQLEKAHDTKVKTMEHNDLKFWFDIGD
ncbi:hypothetical protein VTI74DRAFT_10782 [Chaetomium olivicolor]